MRKQGPWAEIAAIKRSASSGKRIGLGVGDARSMFWTEKGVHASFLSKEQPMIPLLYPHSLAPTNSGELSYDVAQRLHPAVVMTDLCAHWVESEVCPRCLVDRL